MLSCPEVPLVVRRWNHHADPVGSGTAGSDSEASTEVRPSERQDFADGRSSRVASGLRLLRRRRWCWRIPQIGSATQLSLPVDRVVRTTRSPNCTGSCGQLAFVR